jgi:hypothetical protein
VPLGRLGKDGALASWKVNVSQGGWVIWKSECATGRLGDDGALASWKVNSPQGSWGIWKSECATGRLGEDGALASWKVNVPLGGWAHWHVGTLAGERGTMGFVCWIEELRKYLQIQHIVSKWCSSEVVHEGVAVSITGFRLGIGLLVIFFL